MNAAAAILGVSARKAYDLEVPLLTPAQQAEVDAEIARSGDMERRLAAQLPGPTGYERHLARRKAEKLASRNAASAARHTAKMKRQPPWADLTAIKAIYAQAQALTASTGTEHHVDHIYPLQGRLVSGLHVANNLQILTGAENCRKNNRFEIEE